MKKFGFIAVVLVGMMSMALAACADDIFVNAKWRYKMTVTVETPEGDKTGTSVREVSVKKGWQPFPESQPSVTFKGEAVVVDLGSRGALFVLLSGYYLGYDYRTDISQVFFPSGWLSADGIRYLGGLKVTEPKILGPKWYPRMVRFRDPKDPKTVENLLDTETIRDPEDAHSRAIIIKKDHFEEAFGAGVKLKSVTIEMTEAAVTHGVVGKYMPSYSPQEEYMKWFRSLTYGDPRKINIDDFGADK